MGKGSGRCRRTRRFTPRIPGRHPPGRNHLVGIESHAAPSLGRMGAS
jgi:hypothetical protein